MAPALVHFEIPSDNIERAKKFCNGLFGWKMEKMPSPMESWMFATANSKAEQPMSGGVMERKMPSEPITIYIDINSVNEYAKKVENLGGKVIKSKTEVPGHRWFFVCTDTENNIFALWKATNTKQIHSPTSAKHLQFASEILGRGLQALPLSISSAILNVGSVLPILDYCRRHPSPMMIS